MAEHRALPQDGKEESTKSPYDIHRKGFSFLAAGQNLNPWPSAVSLEGVGRNPFLTVSGRHRKTGWPCMPPAHGCPTFLIESAFPAMLSLKGETGKKSAARAWARDTSMSASSWRGASRRMKGRFPGCGNSLLLSVFQARHFSRIQRSSRREPCTSIMPPGDCAAGPITVT